MLKSLHKVSPGLQWILFKLQKFDLTLYYTKGKEYHVEDALSCAYLLVLPAHKDEKDLEFAVHSLFPDLPLSDTIDSPSYSMPQKLKYKCKPTNTSPLVG